MEIGVIWETWHQEVSRYSLQSKVKIFVPGNLQFGFFNGPLGKLRRTTTERPDEPTTEKILVAPEEFDDYYEEVTEKEVSLAQFSDNKRKIVSKT